VHVYGLTAVLEMQGGCLYDILAVSVFSHFVQGTQSEIMERIFLKSY